MGSGATLQLGNLPIAMRPKRITTLRVAVVEPMAVTISADGIKKQVDFGPFLLRMDGLFSFLFESRFLSIRQYNIDSPALYDFYVFVFNMCCLLVFSFLFLSQSLSKNEL